jgi:hypothetical protein
VGESAAHAEETLRSARRGTDAIKTKRQTQASKQAKIPRNKNISSSFASKRSRNKTKCARVQEKADISADRIARLNELGFVWDAVAQVNFIYFIIIDYVSFRFVLFVPFRFGFHFVVKMCGRPADLGRVDVADEDVSRGARPLQCQEARAKGETVFHPFYVL